MEREINIDVKVTNVIKDSEENNSIIGNYNNSNGQTHRVILLVSTRFKIRENLVLHCVFKGFTEPNLHLPIMSGIITCSEIHGTSFPARLMRDEVIPEDIKFMTDDEFKQLGFPLD